MSSNISNYSSNIDVDFPKAGVDNDSSGFRNNFANIQDALSTADTEVTELQSKFLQKDFLTGQSQSDPAFNNLNGNRLINGYYYNLFSIASSNNVSAATDIDVADGEAQQFILSDDVDFRFVNWPDNARFAKIRVHFLNDTIDEWQPSLFTEGGGSIIYDEEFPVPFKTKLDVGPPVASVPQVIEAWTYDGGATVFVKHLGSFADGSNDRIISGDLTVEGNTSLDSTTASSLTISGATALQGSVTATSLEVSGFATFNGTVTIKGSNITLGDSKVDDKVTFNSVPVFPSLTSTQRDGLISLAGMVIFNSTTTRLQVCTVPGTGGTATWVDLH